MLSQAVEALLGAVHGDQRLRMIGFLTVHLNRPQHTIRFGHERLAVGAAVGDRSVGSIYYDSQTCSRELDFVAIVLTFPINRRPRVFENHILWFRRELFRG